MAEGLRCPKCRGWVSADGPIETAWRLCPHCSEVIEEAPAPAGSAPAVPEPAKPARPRRRSDRVAGWFNRHALALVAGIILSGVLTAFVIWYRAAYYPTFYDSTPPGGEITVAFPGQPLWHQRHKEHFMYGMGPDARLTRTYAGGRKEVYSVSVALHQAGDTPPRRIAADIAQEARSGLGSDWRLGHTDGLDWAEWLTGEAADGSSTRSAGRVIVVGPRRYILSVSGPDVSWNDWRVQKFSNSFRLHHP